MWVFLFWWIILMGATLTALLQERLDRVSESRPERRAERRAENRPDRRKPSS
jgi:uncharacterized BrkB/YihY/UPF0761 family membrane protein